MAQLARHHCHQPADECGGHGVGENEDVRREEAERTHQMQGLVDAAVVVVTMVIPALLLEFGKKGVHSLLHSMRSARLRCYERVIGGMLRTHDKPLYGQLFLSADFMSLSRSSFSILARMRIMIVTDAWFPQTNGVVNTL